jgi:hypothetical protein
MSGLNIQNSRIQQKYSTFSGETPTIAPSTDHTDGTWTPTDIYVGEVFFNVVDDAAWFRSLNGIVPLTSGATYISTYVNITGGTMTGGLVTPSLSATSITGTTIYSNNFNGVYYGDGSNLTGITATIFTGGTVSGNTIFTNNVDMCAAALSASTISGCGGELDIQGNLNVIGNISGNTFYGDGSGLTNLPSLTAVTLDNVLTQGDTSTNGNIVLTNGDMTLTNGTFFGDGSGLTNVPFGPTPTLDDVLQSGNTSTNGDILLTNGSITLGNGIFYGDGSGLTNLPIASATTQTLAQVLVNGNTTDGNDIIFNIGDKIKTPDGTAFSMLNTDLFRGTSDNGIGQVGTLDVESGAVLMYASDSATTITTEIASSAAGAGGNVMTVSDGVDGTIITQTALGITVTNPYSSSPGIQYAADYSADFQDETLVTKRYVSNAISNVSGFTYTSNPQYLAYWDGADSLNYVDTYYTGKYTIGYGLGWDYEDYSKFGIYDPYSLNPALTVEGSQFGGAFLARGANTGQNVGLQVEATNGTLSGNLGAYIRAYGTESHQIGAIFSAVNGSGSTISNQGISVTADSTGTVSPSGVTNSGIKVLVGGRVGDTHYIGQFQDGTEAIGKVLTCVSSDGFATWQTQSGGSGTLSTTLAAGNSTGANNIVFNENQKIVHSGQTGTSINFTADTTFTGIKKIYIEGLGDGGNAIVGVANEGVSPIVRMQANNLYGGSANIFMIADDAAIVADATNSISLLSNSTNGVTIDGGLLTNTYTVNDGADATEIYQTPLQITVTNPYASSPGIQYAADYSANFVDRTLVDKEYVDNSITGSTTASTISKLVKTYTTITDTVEVDPQGDNTRIDSTNVANDAGAFVNVNSSSGVYLGATNAAGLSNSILYQGDIIRTYMNGAMYTTEKNKNTISNSATTAILTTSLGQDVMVDYEVIIFGAATGGTDTFYYKINTVLRITGFGVVTEMPGATIVQKSIGTTNQSVSYAFTNPLFQATIDWTANKGTSTDGWDWEIKEKYIIKNLN